MHSLINSSNQCFVHICTTFRVTFLHAAGLNTCRCVCSRALPIMPLFHLSGWTPVWMWWCPGWGCCKHSLSNPDLAETTGCYTAKRTWKRPLSTTWGRVPPQSASSQMRRFFKGSHGRLQNIPALRCEIKPFMTVGGGSVVCPRLFSLRARIESDWTEISWSLTTLKPVQQVRLLWVRP